MIFSGAPVQNLSCLLQGQRYSGHNQTMYNESYQHLSNRTALEKVWIDFWECDFVAPGTLASK